MRNCRTHQSKIERKLVFGAVFALLLLGISGILLYQNTVRLIETSDWVSETHETLTLHDELLARMTEAETGLFGFIITGEDDFLQPYLSATNRIGHLVGRLRSLAGENSGQHRALNDLEELIGQRLGFIEHRAETRRAEGMDAAIALVERREAKAVMDGIRARLAAMKHDQRALLEEQKSDSVGRARVTLAFVVGFGLTSSSLLTLVFVLLMLENRRRSASETALRHARDELDLRVQERTAELARTNTALQEEIVENKRAEAAVRDSEQKLAELAHTLEEKNAELEMIVYIASHDLRSPLVNIQGFSGELACACDKARTLVRQSRGNGELAGLEALLEEDVAEAVDYIRAGVSKMDMLLNGFLRFSRLGHAALSLENISMTQLVAEVTQAAEFQLQQAGAIVMLEALPNCVGDRTQVTQVFSNLIENAVKYRDPQRPLEIRVSGRLENGRATYSVSDTGVGIAPDFLKRVFEIFQRLNPSSADGEGLGLTIARKILERQNGTISVESEVGKGSVFHVSLPANEA